MAQVVRGAGEVGEERGRAADGVGRVGDAERRPGVAPRPAEGDAVAPRAERAVHDTLQAGAVQRDESRGLPVSPFPLPVQEVLHPPQISGALLAHRGGEQDGPRRGQARRHDRFRHREERREPAGVVADAGPLESRAAPLHRHVHIRAEDGVEVRGENDGGG